MQKISATGNAVLLLCPFAVSFASKSVLLQPSHSNTNADAFLLAHTALLSVDEENKSGIANKQRRLETNIFKNDIPLDLLVYIFKISTRIKPKPAVIADRPYTFSFVNKKPFK